MIARYATSIGIGAAVTFGLLFLMQLLIATGRGALTEGDTFRITDFVRVERNEVIETKSGARGRQSRDRTPAYGESGGRRGHSGGQRGRE